VNSCKNLDQISGLDVRNIDIVYILDPFMNIRKLHFVQASEIMKTGFVTDQIFPWHKIEDLLHELFGDLKNLLIPVVGANSIFLPFNGPLEIIREPSFIFLYTGQILIIFD